MLGRTGSFVGEGKMTDHLPTTTSTAGETGLGIVATNLFPLSASTGVHSLNPWTQGAVTSSADFQSEPQPYWYDGLCHATPTPVLYETTQTPVEEYGIPVSRDQQSLSYSHMSVCSAPCSYMSLAPAVAVQLSSQLQEPSEYTQPAFNISPYSVSPGRDSLQSYTTSTFSTPSFAFSQAPTPQVWLTPQSQTSSEMPPPATIPDNKPSNTNMFNRPGKRPVQQYSSKSLPPRKKPRLRPSLSDSHVMPVACPSRLRATSVGPYVPHDFGPSSTPGYITPQLAAPHLLPSVLISTPPSFPQTPFFSAPAFAPYTPATSYQSYYPLPFTVEGGLLSEYPGSRATRTTTSLGPTPPPLDPPLHMPQYASRPAVSTPPTLPGYPEPIYQPPVFPGDIYTAPYKRRHPQGHWEGYCHLCDPPRWLDLKNSRYWDDKQRNHGICARTKRAFQEPVMIRWIDSEGQIVSPEVVNTSRIESKVDSERTDEAKEQPVTVSEGLCGTCGLWVAMQGSRSKEKGKATGWWVHAYKVSRSV